MSRLRTVEDWLVGLDYNEIAQAVRRRAHEATVMGIPDRLVAIEIVRYPSLTLGSLLKPLKESRAPVMHETRVFALEEIERALAYLVKGPDGRITRKRRLWPQ
jgi:hypothetical protein